MKQINAHPGLTKTFLQRVTSNDPAVLAGVLFRGGHGPDRKPSTLEQPSTDNALDFTQS